MADDLINRTIQETVQLFPEVFDTMQKEIIVLTGRDTSRQMTSRDYAETRERFVRVMGVFAELKQLSPTPPTSKTSVAILRAINRILRIVIPSIPRNRKPSEWLIEQMKQLGEIPQELKKDLPEGLDYRTKHLNLREFVTEVVMSVDAAQLDGFLGEIMSGRKIITPYQRAFQDLLLPPTFRLPPARTSLKAVEKVKLALHDVLTDWGILVNVVYGMHRLKQRKDASWDSIQRVALWDKVTVLCSDPRLTMIVKQEWVTVRNAIDHGASYLDPTTRCIVFPDLRRTCSWTLKQSILEGRDIFLSTLAMFRIPNFVQVARVPALEVHLKQLTQISARGSFSPEGEGIAYSAGGMKTQGR